MLAKFRRRHFRIHQAAADDDDARVQRQREIGHVKTERTGLEIKNFLRQHVAFLCAGAERQCFFFRRGGGFRQFVAGIFQKFFFQQSRQSGNRRVGFDAALVAATTAREWLAGDTEQMQWRGHVRGLHSGQRVAFERQSIRSDKRRAETGTRHEH